jgi:hypothetical protein
MTDAEATSIAAASATKNAVSAAMIAPRRTDGHCARPALNAACAVTRTRGAPNRHRAAHTSAAVRAPRPMPAPSATTPTPARAATDGGLRT